MNFYKFLLISIIFSFLISHFSFLSFAAITPGKIPVAGDLGLEESPVKSVPNLLGVLRGVVQTTYIVFFIIATLFILFAAYNYLTASGNAEKISAVHKQLIYAGIAIAVALLAVGASTIIGNFLGNPAAGGGGAAGGSAPYIPSSPYKYNPAPTPIRDLQTPESIGGTYPFFESASQSKPQTQPIKGPEGSDR